MDQFERTKMLFGEEAMQRLKRASIAVFGLGGVGGYAVEVFARSGVGRIALVDDDEICLSNLNRQIIATHNTIGRLKVDAAKERILAINPEAGVECYPIFYTPQTADLIDLSRFDYIVDAIDTVSGKLELVMRAGAAGVSIICSMGAGNKMDPSAFMVADIYETSVCPLAKVMRHELRVRGVARLKVVYSKEVPLQPLYSLQSDSGRRQIPGSNAFVPSAAGLVLAGEVIKDLVRQK